MADYRYDVNLGSLESKNALHDAYAIKTAREEGDVGQFLTKTSEGYKFSTILAMEPLVIGTAPPPRAAVHYIRGGVGQLYFDELHQLLYICTLVSGGIRTWKIVGSTSGGSYVFIKYSEEQPASDEDMQDEPAAWMGVYTGNQAEAPIHYTDYRWICIKGPQGERGERGPASEIQIETIPGGHRVSFYNSEYPTGLSFDVMNGDGAGDMLIADYDPDTEVANAGGVKQYISKNICNPNLLDNPWFTVNQRGQNSYTFDSTGGYSVDRWFGINATVMVNSGSVKIKANSEDTGFVFNQRFEDVSQLLGKTLTLSVKIKDIGISSGIIVIRLAYGNTVGERFEPIFPSITIRPQSTPGIYSCVIQMPSEMKTAYSGINFNVLAAVGVSANDYIEIEAVKLELGSISTLANDITPDYATELLKCQRYYQMIELFAPELVIGNGIAVGRNLALINISAACPMRTTPTVSAPDDYTVQLRLVSYGGSATTVTSITNCFYVQHSTNIMLYVNAQNISSSGVYSLVASVTPSNIGGKIEFSADL